jgi:hypothetical protein
MFSGPELSQVSIPTKFGAALPASANVTGVPTVLSSALWPRNGKPIKQTAVNTAAVTID